MSENDRSSSAANYETILVDIAGPVATVTLDRPDAMNAWNWQMSAELGQAFGALDADDAVRAIVVTGAGRAFCAGADLGGGGGTFSGAGLGTRDTTPVEPPHRLATPIIAAINGAAVGAGLTMTLEWDIRVAADDAKLGFVFNRRGIMPDADLLWLVPRLIGFSNAMELLLTGRIFLGEEAKALGLVSRSVPRDQVLAEAQALALDIATNTAPVSVAITKRLGWAFLEEDDRGAALRTQSRFFAWTGRQPDAVEGVTAFLERRPPAWKLSKTKDLPPDLP